MVSGFRGLSGDYVFDLDAEMVIIHGPNGSGKTSLLDAILWGLTGVVSRVGDASQLVGKFAFAGEARVELDLRAANGSEMTVVRRFGSEESLLVRRGGESRTGSPAEEWLLSALWPEAGFSSDPAASLHRAVTRSVYLQQDQLNEFLSADTDGLRFEIVADLVGAGRLSEMVRQMDSSRRAWTKATNQLRSDLEPVDADAARLRRIVADLKSSSLSMEGLPEGWVPWLEACVSAVSAPLDTRGPREQVIERVISALRREQRSFDEFSRRLSDYQSFLPTAPEPVDATQVANCRARVAEASDLLRSANSQLLEAQAEAARLRQAQIKNQERAASLSTMAQLARQNLSSECPVCGQGHDMRATLARLDSLIEEKASPVEQEHEGVDSALALVGDAQTELSDEQAALRDLLRREAEFEEWQVRSRDLLEQVTSLGTGLQIEQADLALTSAARESERLVALQREGESFAVAAASLDEARRVARLEEELRAVASEAERLGALVAERDRISEGARLMHEALRDVSESSVDEELSRVEPLLQRMYASADPHPAFKAIEFLTQTSHGRGRLATRVSDPDQSDSSSDPAIVLSSSQLNVLAVVTFLALNLSVPSPPLETVILDDPLQSLDDINLLGLADLVRRVRRHRQVIVSTHDIKLAGLLERKLRPTDAAQRTVVISLQGWTKSGPIHHARSTAGEEARLRLAPSAS